MDHCNSLRDLLCIARYCSYFGFWRCWHPRPLCRRHAPEAKNFSFEKRWKNIRFATKREVTSAQRTCNEQIAPIRWPLEGTVPQLCPSKDWSGSSFCCSKTFVSRNFLPLWRTCSGDAWDWWPLSWFQVFLALKSCHILNERTVEEKELSPSQVRIREKLIISETCKSVSWLRQQSRGTHFNWNMFTLQMPSEEKVVPNAFILAKNASCTRFLSWAVVETFASSVMHAGVVTSWNSTVTVELWQVALFYTCPRHASPCHQASQVFCQITGLQSRIDLQVHHRGFPQSSEPETGRSSPLMNWG